MCWSDRWRCDEFCRFSVFREIVCFLTWLLAYVDDLDLLLKFTYQFASISWWDETISLLFWQRDTIFWTLFLMLCEKKKSKQMALKSNKIMDSWFRKFKNNLQSVQNLFKKYSKIFSHYIWYYDPKKKNSGNSKKAIFLQWDAEYTRPYGPYFPIRKAETRKHQ